MNKEQQIEKDRLIQIEEIDELIREKFHGQVAYRMDIGKYGGFNGYTPLCTYDISKALYNAGYRKIPEDNICEAVEKPVDTQKREYESIEDIVRGFVVKDGKILYVTNILDGYRHEFKDIHEICDEMNAMMKQLDSLTELSDYLKAMNKEIRDNTAQEILSQLAKMANRETPLKADIEELAEKWGVEVKQ